MSIRKPKDSQFWWIDFRTPTGERIRRSTCTADKKLAQEYHDRLKAQLWRQDLLGEETPKVFEDAAIFFLRTSEGQADYETKVRHVKYFRQYLSGKNLRSLTSEIINNALPTHKLNKKGKSQPLSPATRNRYIASIQRILNLSKQNGWIDNVPYISKQREPKVLVRFITKDEASLLLSNMGSNSWMRDICSFALSTGMRANEILSLEWTDVDIHRKTAWVKNTNAKSGRARSIPLNDNAVTVIRARLGFHNRYVFGRTSDSERSKAIDSRIFARACRDSGIRDFRFHDLRHTWASWHAQAGTPLLVLKSLGGWESISMVQKYAHLAENHLAEHANAVMFWSQEEPKKRKAT